MIISKLSKYSPSLYPAPSHFKSDLPDFQITERLWAGRTLYDLYQWAHPLGVEQVAFRPRPKTQHHDFQPPIRQHGYQSSRRYQRARLQDSFSLDVIAADAIRSVRPGFRLPTKHHEFVAGKTATQGIRFGTALKAEIIEGSDFNSVNSQRPP